MSFWDKVVKFATGGIGEKIIDTVKDYFPPSMTDQEKAQVELVIRQVAHQETMDLANAAHEERAQFNNRVHNHEGTAKELQQFGVIGKLIIFLRGCQRPIWGYGTLYIDFMWFSGKWTGLTQQQESALWVVNLLVLGFLFGERAIKNVAPAIGEIFKQKYGK